MGDGIALIVIVSGALLGLWTAGMVELWLQRRDLRRTPRWWDRKVGSMSEDAQAPFRGSVEREVLVIEQDGYWLVHVVNYYPYMNRKSTRYIDRAAAYDAAIVELRAAKEYTGEYAV